ncbi:MAG: hypothetical protein HY898_12290 [Deltaproteobacteria bacterium]|nr:hypothetical protein [Deltaproteobacteria bacterium]
MGRPKLARTKEQIAIRLSPGTKARLAALLRTLGTRGARPIRSEVLRQAIERGLAALEAEAHGKPEPVASPARVAQPAAPSPKPVPAEASGRARPAPPPPRIPVPSTSRRPAAERRGPIPGTLADRAWIRLQALTGGDRSRDVPLPELCRAAWPPNPARVRDALAELVDLGLVELRPLAGGERLSGAERDLLVHGAAGAVFGLVRMA